MMIDDDDDDVMQYYFQIAVDKTNFKLIAALLKEFIKIKPASSKQHKNIAETQYRKHFATRVRRLVKFFVSYPNSHNFSDCQ